MPKVYTWEIKSIHIDHYMVYYHVCVQDGDLEHDISEAGLHYEKENALNDLKVFLVNYLTRQCSQ